MPDRVEPLLDWKVDHPCPRCGRVISYSGRGRPAVYCGVSCRRRDSAVREAVGRGLVKNDLVVVVTGAPDVEVLTVDELIGLFMDLASRLNVRQLTTAQFDGVTKVVWALKRECRARIELGQKAHTLMEGFDAGPVRPDRRGSTAAVLQRPPTFGGVRTTASPPLTNP